MTPKQTKFVSALLQSRTIKGAATAAGISERTAARWLNENPEVQAAIRAAQDDAMRQAARLAASSAGTALDVLRGVALGDEVSDSARVAACRELLRAALSLNETLTLTDRLAALEAALLPGAGDDEN